jgi:hypothetical protein
MRTKISGDKLNNSLAKEYQAFPARYPSAIARRHDPLIDLTHPGDKGKAIIKT